MSATDIAGSGVPHATPALAEADRLMTVCNSCRYCEGLCAVFPAMELRRAFPDGDLDYLANLCHGCGACYVDCQFAPPHAFAVNVPQTLARLRVESYGRHAWPAAFGAAFACNGLVIASALALCVAGFLAGFVVLSDPSALFANGDGPGAFYRIMPHNLMAGVFGAGFGYALLAILLGGRRFWRATAGDTPGKTGFLAFRQAVMDACRLRYLDGGGAGCFNADDKPDDRRRLFHHLTFYGFCLCFAATSVATLWHYLAGREAPYPIYDLPVLLGMLGGTGLIVGPLGLMQAKARRDRALVDEAQSGMDAAFLVMLLLSSATGFALLAFRATPAAGLLLALHLGVIFAFFVTLPHSRMVHGLYRFLALVRYAAERRAATGEG